MKKETTRSISEGAERELGIVYKVLNHGEVELVDYMGNDSTVARAARSSYQGSVGTEEKDKKLIIRLWKDKHTSPFEMVSLTFRIRLPIFVMRQHVRHRTASLNEWSFRYTKSPDLFYIPDLDNLRSQHQSNKQMSGENLDPERSKEARDLIMKSNMESYNTYNRLIELGLAREQARVVLPVSGYTQIIWNMDMRNLLHYLGLRLAIDAQKEIREYAKVIAKIVTSGWPMIWAGYSESFADIDNLLKQ